MKPQDLLNINHYVWVSRVLISSIELDIFSAVGDEGATLAEVAKKTGASDRGLRGLLNVLIPLGLLTRDDSGKYRLSDFSRASLKPGVPGYAGPRIRHLSRLWESWGDLTECIRTGVSYGRRHPGNRGIGDLVDLAEGLFPRNFMVASMVAESIEKELPKAPNILDVAAGSGAWCLAFLKKDPKAIATALDFGPVLDMAKRKATELGVEARFDVKSGNLRETDFGESLYDLVILGHICHSEGAEHTVELIAKSARSLKAGGRLLIAEMIPEDDRRGPLFPLIFALNMLVNTDEGDTFTFSEYSRWCKDAGLKNARLLAVAVEDHSPLVVADKQ